MRKLPTFASQTIGAHKRDTLQGALSAVLGALIVGLAFGTLGAAGAPVALLGLFLSLSGIAGMVGPRPIDRTLFQPALPLGFACNVLKIRDAKQVVALRVGAPHAAWARARAKVFTLLDTAPSQRRDVVLTAAVENCQRAHDATMLARVRWLGDWPATNHFVV